MYVEEPAFKFLKRLPNQVEGNEGHTGEIECEIEDPEADCEWYFDGKKIEPDEHPEKYEIVVDGLKRKLLIKKCDPNTDRGRYECKCGVVTTGTEFFVRPALKFLQPLADLEGIEEETIELKVEVTKPNQKVKWIRNGRTVNPNEERFANRYVILSNDCTHTLQIKNLNLKDAGEFVVNVEQLSSTCKLTVVECKYSLCFLRIIILSFIILIFLM